MTPFLKPSMFTSAVTGSETALPALMTVLCRLRVTLDSGRNQ